jgi:hypothetical protein
MRLSVWREATFLAAATLVSVAVFLPWLGFDYRLSPGRSAVDDYWKARVPDVVYGRAHRPYVQRILVPKTIRIIRQILPRWALRAIRRTVSGAPLRLPRKFGQLGWEPEYLTEYVVAIPILFGTLLAFPYALRRLFTDLYTAPRAAFLAPVLALALLPPLFFERGTHYLYDFATLLLFTLALAFLAERRIVPFYVVFVLGLLNKETMALASLVFVLDARRWMARRSVAVHALAQVGLIVATQAALRIAFAHNPGGSVEWHLVKNLRLARTATQAAGTLLVFCTAVLVLSRIDRKPSILKRALVALAPLLAASILFGIYGETRAFYEAYPVVFLLSFDSAAAGLGWPLPPADTRLAQALSP